MCSLQHNNHHTYKTFLTLYMHEVEKSREFGIDLQYLFIDFKAAYGSTNRQMLLRVLGEVGIIEKLIRLKKNNSMSNFLLC